MRTRPRVLALLPFFLSLACFGQACIREDGDVARPLLLASTQASFSRTEPPSSLRGRLRFRGGLVLKSADSDFGGLSALLVSADGKRFVAASDEAHWVTGTLEYDDNGDLVGAAGGTIAPYLDMSGHALAGKGGDAEGLAAAGDGLDGDLFVSFEGHHRVWRYPFGRDGVNALPTDIPVPAMVHQAPPNLGLEGITRVADGWLFAASERFRNDDGNYRAWLMPFRPSMPSSQDPPGDLVRSGIDAQAIEISLLPVPPFSITDVRQLPGGDLLTLERRFDTTHGMGVELRRIPWSSVQNAARTPDPPPLDGEIVGAFDQEDEIDNMEGLSVRRGDHGEELVYIVSDDNFNAPLQRTLLWMFELQN